ncbi:MAG: hypothetical protein HY903_10435 [Deltaproteobacteria bacterium]|nr:hypothetical protein [Deltaproteobacteria bacterium]
MLGVYLGLLFCAAAGDSATYQGEVRLTRAVGAPLVSVVWAQGSIELQGELALEVARLQSSKVEVVGVLDPDGKRLRLQTYSIIDVGGSKPLVGFLVEAEAGLALKDGSGSPIPLSLQPRTQQRLRTMVGAKLWVAGDKLVSGELKVQRYGVLRDPPKGGQGGTP